MSIVGLGWGGRPGPPRSPRPSAARCRAPRPARSKADAEDAPTVGGGQSTPTPGDRAPIGDEEREDIPKSSDLFEPEATARIILLQNIVPMVATLAAFLVFRFTPIA